MLVSYTVWVFEVKYKPGLQNKAADALSRCQDEGEFRSLILYPMWMDGAVLNLEE